MGNQKTNYLDGQDAQKPLLPSQQPSAPPLQPWEPPQGIYYPPPPMEYAPPVQGFPYQPAPVPVLVAPEHHHCGHCGTVAVPGTVKGTGLCTWLTCGALCGLGLWLCAPCTFCFDCTKDTVYVCPRCQAELGRERFPSCLN